MPDSSSGCLAESQMTGREVNTNYQSQQQNSPRTKYGFLGASKFFTAPT
jgi:hypothetical protein